jgi:SpoVK/Ycf46/Vps4 family AAA+-type ATPase
VALLRKSLKADQPGPTQTQEALPITAPSPDQPEGHPVPKREDTAAVLAELDGLIGLASVKRQVSQLVAVVQANAERSKAGMTPVNPGLHLVFTGPPGTGKTTVARLVARLYASTGALPGSSFTEASRYDLVAGYVGQTALKTADLINRTRPGVLFIDEAYALTPRHDSDFGAEAIATLVKAMEDYRNDFAVIVAGYAEEMTDFVASNPGLRSRLKTFVDFPNYSSDELTQIFQRFAADSGIGMKDGVLETVEAVIERQLDKPHFGNARFARSLFEEAYARMSLRAAADGKVEVGELQEFIPQDVVWRDDLLERPNKRIGFNPGP